MPNNSITGTVYVQYVVNQTGNIENVQIARSVDPALDEEAIKVFKTLPMKFKPGKIQGKPVKVLQIFWFDFELK